MQTLTLQEAQNRLSELIDAAVSGEEVKIARNDGTIVTLMLLNPALPKPKFGSAQGLVKILDGFDDSIAMLAPKAIEGFENYIP
jgi:antitoxin (DNA-binding transcriptional repressor) of toxin-antitoxin stability system